MLAFLLLPLLGGCVSKATVMRASTQADLGTAYYKEGQVELAIETLRHAVDLDPGNWRARSNLAIAYVAKGQPELARSSFKAALKRAPREAEVLNNYGTFLLAAGDTAEAEAMFRKALEDLDYRNPAIVYSNLSAALIQNGKLEEAERVAEEAVRRMPALCDGYYQLGRAQEQQKDTPGALEAYARLAEFCPSESMNAKVKAGCLQIATGQHALGEALLEEVIQSARGTTVEKDARACLGGGDGGG